MMGNTGRVLLHAGRRVAHQPTVWWPDKGHQPPCFRGEMRWTRLLAQGSSGDLSQGWLTERELVRPQPHPYLRHGQEEAAQEVFELLARRRTDASGFHQTLRRETQ